MDEFPLSIVDFCVHEEKGMTWIHVKEACGDCVSANNVQVRILGSTYRDDIILNTKELAEKIIADKGPIGDVYFAACGGSLVDLYPGFYFVQTESSTMHTAWMTARELLLNPPKHLGKDSLVFVCSHSGNTFEAVEAARFARDHGAAVVTLTHNAESPCNDSSMYPYIYEWSEDAKEIDKPQGVVLSILNEIMHIQESDYKLYELIKESFDKIDGIIEAAMKKVLNATWLFAEKYSQEPFLYIMASGASYSQAYGFAICSLQEMQWMDCCYLHSGEYFHGPFEVTDEDHLYILMMGTGKRRHPLDMRRYMGVVPY